MNLFTSPSLSLFAATDGAGSLAVAVALGLLGIYWLLPKPAHRPVALGTFSALAGLIVLTVWFVNRFGPVSATTIERILFWLFSGGAVLFAGVFVTQRNPARGAIAFAFVIVSVCGLFLLLAAPFLMAATIIIYAGAIIVTFLFVLMLSQTRLASDENDRSREPMLGSLAGFSFLGLVLFALFASRPASGAEAALPARLMLPEERAALLEAGALLSEPNGPTDRDSLLKSINVVRVKIADVVGEADAPHYAGIPKRLALASDPHAVTVKKKAEKLRDHASRTLTGIENKLLKATVTDADLADVHSRMAKLGEEVRLLAAHGELPARNVAAMGYVLYSDYILAVELAGAVLLAATIGAVTIANRRGVAA